VAITAGFGMQQDLLQEGIGNHVLMMMFLPVFG
jgi:hypothetical protein